MEAYDVIVNQPVVIDNVSFIPFTTFRQLLIVLSPGHRGH